MMDSRKLPEGDVAVMFQQILSREQHERIAARLAADFPDRRFLILGGGATIAAVSPDQIDRIEAKLDALIAALAEEDAGDGPALDLDGNLFADGERDPAAEL